MKGSPELTIETPSVGLVCMPWATTAYPSLAIGTIKAEINEAGFAAEVLYPNLELARELGFDLYEPLAALDFWSLLGEWLFAKTAFPSNDGEDVRSVSSWLGLSGGESRIKEVFGENYATFLESFRDVRAPTFCDEIAESCRGFAVVGFSCTFNQLVPALAASRLLKLKNPKVKILLGGSQLEDAPGREILRICPWVDAVYAGDFEVAGIETVRWAMGELECPPQAYVSYRKEDGCLHFATSVAQVKDMDIVPVPNFDEFYSSTRDMYDKNGLTVGVGPIPFESSRGCWWGERSHCTFCGLNGLTIPFRSKSPDVVIEQVLEMSSRYRQVAFQAADNIIDLDYTNTVLPKFQELDLGFEFFFETKANLKRDEIKAFVASGVVVIQPGVESFSTNVLKIMRKGIRGISNIYLLKLCMQYGVRPAYNILMGFPGEKVEDYAQQLEWIPRLSHLRPPGVTIPFDLQRHSPMYVDPGKFGISNVRPTQGYSFVYPEHAAMDQLAFHFDFDSESPRELPGVHRRVKKAISHWKRRWNEGVIAPELTYRKGADFVLINDTRLVTRSEQYSLTGLDKEIFEAIEDPVGMAELHRRFGGPIEVESSLDKLEDLGLIIREGNQVLHLATPKRKHTHAVFRPSEIPAARYVKESAHKWRFPKANRRAARPSSKAVPTGQQVEDSMP